MSFMWGAAWITYMSIMRFLLLYIISLLFFCVIAQADSISKPAKHKGNATTNTKSKKKIKTDNEEEKVGVVASVNGEPITVLDVLEVCGAQESRLPYIYQGAQLQEEIEKLRLDALKEVIDRKLIYQDFKEKGYKLPKKFIEDNFDRLMHSYNINNRQEFEKKLEASGITMAEFREKAYENVAVDILINEMCFADAFITPKSVYDFYIEHKDEYTTPKQFRLQILKLTFDGIHKDELDNLSIHLKKVLNNNSKSEFDDAVLLYSEGPNIERGGDIGWIEKSKLREDFSEYVKDVEAGQVVGPVRSKEAYYFLRIDDVIKEKTDSFKDVHKKIEEKLLLKQKEKNYKAYVENLRSKALIKKYL